MSIERTCLRCGIKRFVGNAEDGLHGFLCGDCKDVDPHFLHHEDDD